MPKPGSLGPGDRWWVLLTIPAEMPAGEHELVLEATVGGGRARVRLGSIVLSAFDPRLAPPSPSIVSSGGGPLVCICMATHEPDPERLAAQVESIRAQDWPDWVCVISDDASSQARFEAIRELTADDERFVVSRSPERLGFYRNFERALRMAPVEARWVALADQDDNWDPDKISALATALSAPRVLLAYSDMRILDEHGRLLSDTYWILRRNSWDDVASMLVANTVTGAASMFERSLLEDALPFPPPIGEPYHDHWLALCALALGELSYVSRPTYERTRHLESVTAGTRHAETLRAMRDGTEAAAAAGPAAAARAARPGRGLARRLLPSLAAARLLRPDPAAAGRRPDRAREGEGAAAHGRGRALGRRLPSGSACARCGRWPGATRRWGASACCSAASSGAGLRGRDCGSGTAARSRSRPRTRARRASGRSSRASRPARPRSGSRARARGRRHGRPCAGRAGGCAATRTCSSASRPGSGARRARARASASSLPSSPSVSASRSS